MIAEDLIYQVDPDPNLIINSIPKMEAVKEILSEAYPKQFNPNYEFLVNLQEFLHMHQEYWNKKPEGLFKHSQLIVKFAYLREVTLENHQAYIKFLQDTLAIHLTQEQEVLKEIHQPHQKKINLSHRLNILGLLALLGCFVVSPPVLIALSIYLGSFCLILTAQYLKNITHYQHIIIEEIKKLSTTDNMIEPATLTPEA